MFAFKPGLSFSKLFFTQIFAAANAQAMDALPSWIAGEPESHILDLTGQELD